MLVTGGPVTGKSTVIKYINSSHDNGEILWMGTTGTADCFIGVKTCHSILHPPVNRPSRQLNGVILTKIQQRF